MLLDFSCVPGGVVVPGACCGIGGCLLAAGARGGALCLGCVWLGVLQLLDVSWLLFLLQRDAIVRNS